MGGPGHSGLFRPTYQPLRQRERTTYEVKGVELQLVAKPFEGLTVKGSSSWNSTNQTNAPCLRSSGTVRSCNKGRNPTPAGGCDYPNQWHTVHQSLRRVGHLSGVLPVYGVQPARALRLRAYFRYRSFLTIGGNHIGSQRNEPASFPDGDLPGRGGCLVNGVQTPRCAKYTMPGYTTYDAAVGISKDGWTGTAHGQQHHQLGCEHGHVWGQFIKSEVPLRPRVITVQLGYKF